MVMTSPSMPLISCRLMSRRRPSSSRAICSTTLIAEAIWARSARIGKLMPVIDTMVSMRPSASRGEFAWIVVSEPSWPVFIACSMSSASAPRTSPTMMRSGRMRSALRTRSRCVTSPLPSMFGGRVSSRTTCGCCSCSSAESSMVTMRSVDGMKAERMFSSVVLPEPVPPEITTFSRACTMPFSTFASGSSIVPRRIRSSTDSSSTREAADRQHRAVERQRRDDRR